MALVKKIDIAGDATPVKKTSARAENARYDGEVTRKPSASVEAQRRTARTHARQQQAAERIAAATNELAGGVAESTAASEELRRAMEQIATGAEEASSAADASKKAVGEMTEMLQSSRQLAEL